MKKFLLLAVAAIMAVSANAQLASKSKAQKAQGKTVVNAQEVKAPKFTVSPAFNRAVINSNINYGSPVAHTGLIRTKAVKAVKAVKNAVSLQSISLNLNEVLTPVQSIKSIRKAPSSLKESYTGNGLTISGNQWVEADPWTMTPSTATLTSGETVDVLVDVIPTPNALSSLYTSGTPIEYTVEGDSLVIAPQKVAHSTNYDVWFASYGNYATGGDGTFKIGIDAEGNLTPKVETVGFFATTRNDDATTLDWSTAKGAYSQYIVQSYGDESEEEDQFTANSTYTGKGKDRGSATNVTWTMQEGYYTVDESTIIETIRNVAPSIFDDSDMDVECTYTDSKITVAPQKVAETASGYYLYLAGGSSEDGTLTITRDPKTGYLTLPDGEYIIIGAFTADEFDPTYENNYAGYWQITNNVVYYAEGQPIPSPAPTILADATENGQLFASLSPSGYSYRSNLCLLPAYTDFTVKNYTSDDATKWSWQADLLDTSSEEEVVAESYYGDEYDFTFPLKNGVLNKIQAIGWNGDSESDPYLLNCGGDKTAAYFYCGSTQSQFGMSDGTYAIITANNPDNSLAFYTNWATPDICSYDMPKIYAYGFKPAKPFYITGIELPVVSFEDKGDFNLTCKLVKATRTNGRLTLGDVIAQSDITADNVDNTYAETSGLTMLNFDNFYIEDEDGMTVDVDHLFLEDEFAIVLDGWNNGTFSGVLGSQETSTDLPTTTWFEMNGKEGSMYSYSGGWPTLFIGYAGAAYGYLNTEDNTNINISVDGGEATIHVEPMLCSIEEDGETRTTRLFVDEMPEWLSMEPTNESYTSDDYSFDLKITAEATDEPRTATVRLYQEGAYLDVTITQGASVKGDVNGDGTVDIADVNAILTVMFSEEESYTEAADVNKDQIVDIADVNAVLTIMFSEDK